MQILSSLFSRQTFREKELAKTLFQYVCKLNVRKLTIRYASLAILLL